MLIFGSFLLSLFQKLESYIVYMGVHSHGLEDAEATVSKVKDSHCQFLASFLGSSEKAKEAIFYSYSQDINGFATTLEDEKAAAIASTYKHYKLLMMMMTARQMYLGFFFFMMMIAFGERE
ncbi:subtilisin-like protease Glyma18g48580 [Camellia sinensis]|uniref:subtilisin-like protease Glyma18g48580 n=1 Tax=Camellia sinensis TaxID=4442 RepID=UPI001035CFCE|nr:subtilisin-like protease Glyma18g48580 [Camellia sinensis]